MKFLVVAILSCVRLMVESAEMGKGVAQIPVLSLDGLLNNMLRLERTVTQLRSEVKELKVGKETLANTTVIERGRRVAFEVVLLKSMTVGRNEPLKFDHVALNTGNAYNQHSGIFLVPVSGTYLFWANVLGLQSNYLHVSLFKEEEELTQGYTGHSLHSGTVTINHVVQLKKGDHVWFADVSGTHTVYGNKNSNYGGILMYA